MSAFSDRFPHFVSASCEGEWCHMCDEPATHKVGEEIPWDTPANDKMRHNLTTYLCCQHFADLMGPICVGWCPGVIAVQMPPRYRRHDEAQS